MVNGLSKIELWRNRSYTLLETVLSYLILVEIKKKTTLKCRSFTTYLEAVMMKIGTGDEAVRVTQFLPGPQQLTNMIRSRILNQAKVIRQTGDVLLAVKSTVKQIFY